MDCSSWYTNRSSAMLACPTQPLCCNDTQCFDAEPELGTYHVDTLDSCADAGLVCYQPWTDKHQPARCVLPDFAASSMPQGSGTGGIVQTTAMMSTHSE